MTDLSPLSHAQPENPPPPDIHLVVDDKIVGPISSDEIVALHMGGRIGPATLAWHPALDGWAAIETLPEISALLPLAAAAEPKPGDAAAQLAGFGVRFAAGAVDMLAWLSSIIAIALPLGLWTNFVQGLDRPLLGSRFDLLAQVGAALYFILPMSRIGGGATPGYSIFGLRLVDRRSLRPPTFLKTVIWYITTYVRLVGCLTFFIDSHNRMLHNLASDTLVIVDRGPKT